jgi:hypothetical protein
MDQWDSVTGHYLFDVVECGVVTLSPLFNSYSASALQFVPQLAIIPKLYPEKLMIESQPFINSFNLFYLL